MSTGKETTIAGKTYMDATKASGFVGMNRYSLMELARRGKVKSVRVGRCVWFRPEWLESYIDAITRGKDEST